MGWRCSDQKRIFQVQYYYELYYQFAWVYAFIIWGIKKEMMLLSKMMIVARQGGTTACCRSESPLELAFSASLSPRFYVECGRCGQINHPSIFSPAQVCPSQNKLPELLPQDMGLVRLCTCLHIENWAPPHTYCFLFASEDVH